MTWIEWCNSPSKPATATISLIWALVYPVITVSFVFVQAFRQKMPSRAALPFAVNLVANLPSMPVFAGLRSVPSAENIAIAWTTLIRCVVAVAQLPCFARATIATALHCRSRQ